jgi:mersacidin/lichenicidin family type 2 lantibiotic
MSNRQIIRAWKSPGYRNALSPAELAALPPNPAGAVEISDEDLGKVAGGGRPPTAVCSLTETYCCWTLRCGTLPPGC